ncbi:hypothetical protein FSP39_009897 [Pinctada imbricata]|uniref:Retrotransposon gag domain-containing protein n=1 Tax=Pinctada imbricata TaxID=66713 RepID=A0AA88YGM6_PINIB|nr:hypothetical protein FSP39_009897 [Pinctada imbricata]
MSKTNRPSNYPSDRILRSTSNNDSVEPESSADEQEIVEETQVEIIRDNRVPEPVLETENMASGIALKKYSGTESPIIWLSQLEAWQNFHNISEERTLQAIAYSLEGGAASWWQTLPDEVKTTLSTFKTEFKKRFNSGSTDISIMSIKQFEAETAEEFLQRAERVALGHELPERYKVQLAVKGLKPDIRSRVLGKEPSTFSELRRCVQLAQAEIECLSHTCASVTSVNEHDFQKELLKQVRETVRDELCVVNRTPTNFGQQGGQFRRNYPPRQEQSVRNQNGSCRWCGTLNLSIGTIHLLVCVIAAICSTSPALANTIQRVNYGIMFEKQHPLHLGQESWIHTFEIPLPKMSMELGNLQCTDRKCQVAKHLLQSINALRTQTVTKVNTTLHDIRRLIPRSVLPPEENYVGHSRVRRGLFDFIGKISKSLFGTATSDDINTMKRHMQVLNRNNAKLAKAMAIQDEHLSSFISTVDERFGNIMQAVQKNHKEAIAIAESARHSIDAVEHEFLILEEIMLKQVNASATLLSALEHVTLSVHDLVKGKLSPFLLKPNTIEHSLKQIQSILDTKFPDFVVIHKDPLYYYSFADFLYTRLHSTMYIILKVPISPMSQPLELYRVFSFPVPVNESSSHATQLMDIPDYFAHSKDNQHFTTLSNSQVAQCTGSKTRFCPANVPLSASAAPSCISSIFYNQKEFTSKSCNFRFVLNKLYPTFIELSPSSVLLYRIPMAALNCGAKQKIIKGCNFCVMDIPCMCSITSDSLYLPPRLGKCKIGSDEVSVVHPVNLALLQEFFSPEAHSTIFGDTIFESFVNLKVPPIKIFNHSFNQYLANDEQYHFSLKKMASAAKKDGTVFKSLAESMLAGQVEFAVDQWPDTSGVIAIIATILSVLSISTVFYTFCKLRSLSAAMLLMHQTKPISAFKLSPAPSFTYTFPPELTTARSLSEHIYTSFTTPYPYVALSVLTTILIIVLGSILWHKFKQSHKTAVHIELTSGSECVVVRLLTLPLCPENWIINPPYDISSIFVTGFPLLSTLTIQCTQFQITNVLTKHVINTPTVIRITPLKALKIRKILAQPFTAYFLISHHGYFKLIE